MSTITSTTNSTIGSSTAATASAGAPSSTATTTPIAATSAHVVRNSTAVIGSSVSAPRDRGR